MPFIHLLGLRHREVQCTFWRPSLVYPAKGKASYFVLAPDAAFPITRRLWQFRPLLLDLEANWHACDAAVHAATMVHHWQLHQLLQLFLCGVETTVDNEGFQIGCSPALLPPRRAPHVHQCWTCWRNTDFTW